MTVARGLVLASLMLTVIVWSVIAAVRMAHGQAIGEPQRAYTVADPVREGGLGLATLGGRYAISVGDGCTVGPDTNVELAEVRGFTGIAVMRTGPNDSWCMIRFEQQVSEIPCFWGDDGQCDIEAERD